jgi:hypothetical protein
VNKSWLFWHIIDALRSETSQQAYREITCPLWLAVGLGAGGFAFLLVLIAHQLLHV